MLRQQLFFRCKHTHPINRQAGQDIRRQAFGDGAVQNIDIFPDDRRERTGQQAGDGSLPGNFFPVNDTR